MISTRPQMTSGSNSLAERLRAKRAEQAAIAASALIKEERLLALIKTRVQELKDLARTVGINDRKETTRSELPSVVSNAGTDAYNAAIEAGYVNEGASSIRSCKVFWAGVMVSKRAFRAKLDVKKMVQFLCDSIRENLRDC